MRTDTASIPAQKTALFCNAAIGLMGEIFFDPDAEAEYQAWLKKRKKGETENEAQNLP